MPVSCPRCLAQKSYEKVEQNGFKAKYECSYCGSEVEVKEYQESVYQTDEYRLIRSAIGVIGTVVIVFATVAILIDFVDSLN